MEVASESTHLQEVAASKSLSNYGDLLTVSDVSNLLSISDRTVYRLVDKDELPFVKIGRRLYFPKHMLVELLKLEDMYGTNATEEKEE